MDGWGEGGAVLALGERRGQDGWVVDVPADSRFAARRDETGDRIERLLWLAGVAAGKQDTSEARAAMELIYKLCIFTRWACGARDGRRHCLPVSLYICAMEGTHCD